MKNWEIKDREYQIHAQKCRDCVAAGQKPGILKRCDAGSLLWDSYKESFESENPQKVDQFFHLKEKLKRQKNMPYAYNGNSPGEFASQKTPKDKKTMNLF